MCHNVPSYPWCNLFYRQLQSTGGVTLPPPATAPVGINIDCGIPKSGDGSLGNIANMVVCGVSIIITALLILQVSRRRAAVGRVELRTFLLFYVLSLALQIVTTGAVLEQGGTPITVLTAIHAAIVALLFWFLFWNGVVATQIVEDGTLSSLIPFFIIGLLLFVGTLYVALDTGLGFTNAFKSSPPADLKNIALFILTSIWPGAAIIFFFILMAYVITVVLRERKPLAYLALGFIAMAASQVVFMLANDPLCKASQRKVDGSFIATLLETVSVVLLVVTWSSVTEESWGEEGYY